MEIQTAMKKRYSIRSFQVKKPTEHQIHTLIEYANLAPSAGNLQARDFIIVDDQETKNQLAHAALNQMFVAQAPIVLVVCANLLRISSYGHRGTDLYCLQDAAAAIEHILLLAVEMDLGGCWVGAFNEKRATDILHLPKGIRPVALIPIGYPNIEHQKSNRIPINRLIHRNQW